MSVNEAEALSVFDPESSGGSGKGISFYRAIATGCPFAAWLHEQGEAAGPKPLGVALKVGIYYHKLQEARSLAAIGKTRDWAFDIKAPGVDKCWSEALDLYFRYCAKFLPDKWGEILDVEYQLEDPKIEDFFGFPVTGKIDLLVRLSATDIARLANVPGLERLGLSGPGIYMVDYKTQQDASGNDFDYYWESTQAALYHKLFELQTGEAPKGFIVDGINRLTRRKRKTVKGPAESEAEFLERFNQTGFFHQLVSPPSPERINSLKDQLSRDYARYVAKEKNLHCCWTTRHKPCTFRSICERGV